MLKAYRYRIYPDKNQTVLIKKHIGSCRFAYNHALEVKEFTHILEGRIVNAAINIKNYSIKECGMSSREKALGAAGHLAGVMNQELPVKGCKRL
jgi:transposase